MGVIYVRPNLINGKKYVGQATDLKVREYHWRCLSQPYAGVLINRAREKYGIEAFGFEILKECNDDELDYWEKYYIKELNTKVPYGYNLTDGGEGRCGYSFPHTAETKIKISKGNKGKKRSEEARKNISEGKKGEKNPNYGKHLSEKCKNKLSKRMKGENNPFYGKHHTEEFKKKKRKAVLQLDKDNNEIIKEWSCAIEVEKELGIQSSHICNCCKGKRKTCGGFIWRYKESVA